MGWNLETMTTLLTSNSVINPDQIITQLRKQCTVAVVYSMGQAIFSSSPNPPNGILCPQTATRTGTTRSFRLRPFIEEVTLMHRNSPYAVLRKVTSDHIRAILTFSIDTGSNPVCARNAGKSTSALKPIHTVRGDRRRSTHANIGFWLLK